ncbi:hypothetical protein NMG60_11024021 [Bertholletia excelsa]
MADLAGSFGRSQPPPQPLSRTSFPRRLHEQAPNLTQIIGALIEDGVFLLLAGVAITGVFLVFVFFIPLVLITSPIWIPVFILVFLAVAGFLSLCGFCAVAAAVLYWTYSRLRGQRRPGSDRLDHDRIRAKIRDVAPGA